jgi:uncharacterized membrane protein
VIRRPREPLPESESPVEPPKPSTPELTNIQAIVNLERRTRENRSSLDRLTDAFSALASSPAFVAGHIVWFAGWMGWNLFGRAPFDPYPFQLLTLAVSLEAIVLTGFVLMAQSRMRHEADKRAHLDLQINLLAEQELTAILKLQCQLAERAGVDLRAVDPRLDQFRTHIDVEQLAETIATEMAVEAPPELEGAASSPRD